MVVAKVYVQIHVYDTDAIDIIFRPLYYVILNWTYTVYKKSQYLLQETIPFISSYDESFMKTNCSRL